MQGIELYLCFGHIPLRRQTTHQPLKELGLCEGRNTGFPKALAALDANGLPRPTFRMDEVREFLSDELSGNYLGYFPYTGPERSFWEGKASRIEWPIEYGSALAWDEILSYIAFYGLVSMAACIAVSGVFAGEYQGGTASIVLPTPRGKRSLPVAKVFVSMLFATAYWWVSRWL